MTSDRKSTRLNSSHLGISYAVFCLKKKKNIRRQKTPHANKLISLTAVHHIVCRVALCLESLQVARVSAAYLLTVSFFFFFFNDRATTEIYPLSLHDALPITTMRTSPTARPSTSRNLSPPAPASLPTTSARSTTSSIICGATRPSSSTST